MSRFGGRPVDPQVTPTPPVSRFGGRAVPPAATPLPSNFVAPTAGGGVDQRLIDLAASMPGTQFDFSGYNQAANPGTQSANRFPSSPQQEQQQAALTQQFDRLTSRVDPETPAGQAANQLLIEDANVTPIEAAGGYAARESQLKQQALERTPRAVRPVATGFLQSGLSSTALLGQVTDAIGATEGLADSLNAETQQLSDNRRALGTSTFENAAEGVTRSITDLFTLGQILPGAGVGTTGRLARLAQARGPIAAFTAKAMNDAEYRGSQAGLSGADLANYVLLQGTIEGGTTAIFSLVGLGGYENLKQGVTEGLSQSLKKMGVQTLGELGEENLIGVMSAVTDALTGVDPTAATPENLMKLAADTSLATLMTMGLAEGTTHALEVSRGHQQKTDAVSPDTGLARGDRDFRVAPKLPAGRSLGDVAGQVANADPDVKKDIGERQPTADFFSAQARETLKNSEDPYVLVDLPVDRVDLTDRYQAGKEQEYAQQPAETAPPALGGVRKGSDRFVLVDGNTRARAARQRGEATIKAYVPQTDAMALQPLALPSPVGIAEQRAAEAGDAARAAENRLAQEQAALAQQPSGEGAIEVDPAGTATTPEQRTQIDQTTQSITQPQLDPSRLLPGQQARFVVDQQGQAQDLQPTQTSPQADEDVRRSPATTDAVTQEADALVADMRKRAKVSDADEARIRALVNDARRNPLTGGMNRRAFSKVFDAIRTRARKTNKPVSIIAFDAANLKAYNDKVGESAGDEYLKRVQRVLEQSLRGADVGRDRIGDAFHYGGDEWAVVLPDTDAAGAQLVRDRIEAAFGREEIVPGVSAFLVGEPVTVNPNSRRKLRGFLDDAAKGMKARKEDMKRAAGEAVTREEAEALAGDPAPVQVTRRSTAGVKDAAAAFARAKREVERTQAAVDQIKAEQAAAVANNEPGASDPADLDAISDVNTPPDTPKVVSQYAIRRAASYVGTPMGYTLERWAPNLYKRLKQLEAGWRNDRHEAYSHIHELRRAFSGRKRRAVWSEYSRLMRNREVVEANQYLSEQLPKDAARIKELFEVVQTAKNNLYSDYRETNDKVGYIEDHWIGRPRRDKIDEFLMERRGPEAADDLYTAIATEETRRGRGLSPAEKVEVANKLLAMGRPPKIPGQTSPREFSKRTNEKVDKETWDKYYDTGFDSVYEYFNTLIYNTHKARLFGKGAADASLDETVGRMFVEGKYGLDKLSPYQRNKLRSLITSRFGTGERTVGPVQRTLRDIGYAAYLGDMWSTATQLLDVVNIAVRDGAVVALQASPAAFKRTLMSAQKHGLRNVRDEYSGSVSGTGKMLEFVTKLNLFSFGDERALTVGMNAALIKARKEITKNADSFRRKWSPYFDNPAEMDQLVNDIRARTPSDLAYLYAYMRSSETRPMDVWDSPQAYSDSPKLRWMYQFKLFPLKQLNLVRRKGYDKIGKGLRTNNPRLAGEGMVGLVRAMMMLGLAGASLDWIKAWVMGQDREFSDLVLNNLLFTHLGSTFMLRNAGEKGPGGAAVDMFIPPTASVIDNVWRTVKGDNVTAIKHVPVIGRTWYSQTEEGRNKEARRARTTLRDKARDALIAKDVAGARTYINQYNRTMRELGRKERLSMFQVRSAAKRKEQGK